MEISTGEALRGSPTDRNPQDESGFAAQPLAGRARAIDPDEESTEKLPPEYARAVLIEHLKAHCETWHEQRHPALGGQTPRAAVATAEGRRRVLVLIAELENQLRGTPYAEECDFRATRRLLGLDSVRSGATPAPARR